MIPVVEYLSLSYSTRTPRLSTLAVTNSQRPAVDVGWLPNVMG